MCRWAGPDVCSSLDVQTVFHSYSAGVASKDDDDTSTITTPRRASLSSAVLGTRAPLTPQPLVSQRFVLAWNGQVWQGSSGLRSLALEAHSASNEAALKDLDPQNDAAALFLALHALLERQKRRGEESDVGTAFAGLLASLDGPYATVLIDVSEGVSAPPVFAQAPHVLTRLPNHSNP